MRSKGKSWKERICALLLALVMVLTGIMPGSAATVEAAMPWDKEVEVTFNITDSEGNILDEALIKVEEKDSIFSQEEIVEKDPEKGYVINLIEGKTYLYSVEKSGYKMQDAEGEFSPSEENNVVEVKLDLSDIELESNLATNMIVDQEQSIKVANLAEDKVYTCRSDNSDVISVTGDAEHGWTLKAVGAGNAEIIISIDGTEKENRQEIIVTKKELDKSDLILSVDPTADPNSYNVESIECKVSGFPMDAAEGATVTFVVNNSESEPVNIQQVEDEYVASYTYKPADGMKGEYTIYAVYSGNTKYNSLTTDSKDTGIYMKDVPLTLLEGTTPKEITIGDDSWNASFNFPLDPESVKDRSVKYSVLDGEQNISPVTVDELTGEIKPQHAGKATIIAETQRDGIYKESSVSYTVEIIPGEKTCNDFVWEQNISLVYDADELFQIKGVLNDNANYEVTLNAVLTDANVGKEKSFSITPDEYNVTDDQGNLYYILDLSESEIGNEQLGTTVEVEPRPVYVKINKENEEAVQVQYGRSYDELKKEIEAKENLVSLVGGNGELAPGHDSGYLGEDKAIKLPNATLDDTKASEVNINDIDATVENIVIPDVTTGDAGCNYQFELDTSEGADNRGDLAFVNQKLSDEDVLKYITVSEEGTGIDVRYDDDNNIDNIWVAKNATLKLSIKAEYREYYNVVRVSYDEDGTIDDADDAIDATRNGITFDQWNDGEQKASLKGKGKGKIWLQKYDEENEVYTDIYTVSVNSEEEKDEGNTFDIVNVDSQSPKVYFAGLENAGVVGQSLSAITFGVFKQEAYVETVDVADVGGEKDKYNEEEEKFEGDEGSGLVSKEYYVWKLSDDIKEIEEMAGADHLTAEVVKKKVLTLQDEDWTLFSGNSIDVGVGETKNEMEDNYLVFVRTSDAVGNSDIYVSNGLVIEANAPSITVSMEDKPYYNGDVEYTLKVDENTEGFKSGLKRIAVNVTCNDNLVEGNDEKYTDSYEKIIGKDIYTYEELNNDSHEIEINGKITAENNNSNNVHIKIEAEDNAGNISTWEKDIIIDTTLPEITVSYETVPGEKDTPQNDIYFSESRIMTIQYKERNMETDPTKSGITFDIVKDGVEYPNCTLSDLGSLEGIEDIEWIDEKIDDKIGDQDTPEDEKQYTEERTCTLQLDFSKDGDYTIIPKCEDKAGNIAKEINYSDPESKANETFVIDKTAPIISVDYIDADGTEFLPLTYQAAEDKRVYSTKPVKATITIDEKNFYLEEDGEKVFATDQFSFDGTNGVDSSDQSIEAVNADDYLAVAENTEDTNWSTVGYVRTNSNFIFSTDANYTFKFTYTDLAGNKAEYNELYNEAYFFTVDKPETDAPKGTISLDKEGNIWDKAWKVVTFNLFRNDSYQVDIDGADDISGVKSIEYFKTTDPISEDTDMESLNWRPLDVTGEKPVRSGGFTVPPDEQFVVYEKITDYADNVTYIYPTKGAVADNTCPEIDVACTNLNAARNEIFNEDVHFSVSVKDRVAGDTYSGIKRVWYTVTASGNVTNAITEENPKSILFTAESEADLIQNNKVRNAIFTIRAAAFNSNDVRVQVHAEDLSGNISHSEVIPIKIDTKAPEITVQYNSIPAVNGDYYNATRVATVTVTERNFDPSAVRFNITNTDGVQPSISGWSPSGNIGVSDNETHTCTVTFAADGDYTFTLNTTDLAGNATSYGRVDEFTIDQTDPTIQVSYDNNNDAEPGYFNASRTATVTINEHNFNAADVNAMITASLQGSGASAPGLSGWTTRGDSHTATVTFSSDADYTFDIDYTDLAGNAAADYTQDSFTVDQTAPEIEFFDITDKSANKGEVAPGVRYSDINYTESGVEITLTGANNGDESVDGIRSSIPNGQSIKLEDFAHEKEVDDLYTMTAVVTDRAGNETEQSVMFSVNRFGSVYVMSNDTQELLDKVYTNEEQDLVVTEINVDSLVFNGISSGRDGNLTTLTEGEDYTVRESGAEDSWKQYTYTIDKENFETEGNYTVTIESEDQAENLSSTQVKKVQSPTDETQLYELEFAVDKTAPTVVLTGIEDGGQYRSNVRDVTVNTSDNIAMGDVKVYLGNSDEATTFSAEDIQAADGELTYTIPSSNTRQDIRAVATDAAGNTSETEINRVLVTSNLFVQFYSNTPLLAGSIAGVVVIAAALWYFLIFKRKKDEEKQANRR